MGLLIMHSKRIQWLDFAKGVTILLVVLSHSTLIAKRICGNSIGLLLINYVVSTVIMPLFFAISGFLYHPVRSGKDYLILLYKKITSFVIPYSLFTILYVWLFDGLGGYRSIYNFAGIKTNLTFIGALLKSTSYLWFLYALFFIFLLVGLLDLLKISLKYQLILALIAVLGESIGLPPFTNYGYNPLAGILGYWLFFIIGFVIHKYHWNPDDLHWLMIVALWLILMIVQVRWTSVHYFTDGIQLPDLLTKLLSVGIGFPFFIRAKHGQIFDYFDRYGKMTLVIYLVHYLWLMLMLKVALMLHLNDYHVNNLIGVIVICAMAWCLSAVTCKLIKRCGWLEFWLYPRKYVDKWICDFGGKC